MECFPFFPILFNLFIKDALNKCDEFCDSIGNKKKKYCGGLFTDDIVLITPSKQNMTSLLRHVFKCTERTKCHLK